METESISSKTQDEELILVLHISEAIGVNKAEGIQINFSVSGNKMETDVIRPGHTTLFDCNLVFETSKNSIKKMKLENLPVKIECFALKNDKGSIDRTAKERIGYILIPIKNIPTVPLPKALHVKPRWMKFIGLSKDWRPQKPELLLNIMITTKEFLECDKAEELESHSNFECGDSIVIDENLSPSMLTSQKGIFVRLLQEEGLLQVGSIDTNCDVFVVKIIMKNLRYLENLTIALPAPELFINYELLGNPHQRALDKKFNRTFQLQEKVSIKFRSSLVSLQEYFEKIFFIPFEVKAGDNHLGDGEIKLNQLISKTNIKEFLETFPSSICELEGVCTIKTTQEFPPTVNKPVLEYKIMIQYLESKYLHQKELLDNYKRYQQWDAQGGGDQVEPKNVQSPSKIKALLDVPEEKSEESSKFKAVGVVNKPQEPPEKFGMESIVNSQVTGRVSELRHLFIYNLHVSSIKFIRLPERGAWQFSCYHEKAETPRQFINKNIQDFSGLQDSTIAFEDVEMRLYFTSHPTDIMALIKSSDNSTLCICGPRGFQAKAQLECESLLIGNKEKTQGNILLLDKTENVVAMASIFVSLDDLGLNFNAKPHSTQHDPWVGHLNSKQQKDSIVDEDYTFKMIEELDEWKTQQQEMFMTDLKNKESMFLERLKAAWDRKQIKMEGDIVSKADKMQTLAKLLEEAQMCLKEKEIKHSREYQQVETMKNELEKYYKDQLLAIRERARQMEDDILHEMKLKDIRYDDMERSLQHVKTENCELRQCNACLQKELHDIQADRVPKFEVEKLLQEMQLTKEKLDAVEKSKSFYKEEWAKAFRECHKVQRENISSIKNDLFNTKYTRLCGVLDDNDCELNFDKEELDEIKHCLNLSDDEL